MAQEPPLQGRGERGEAGDVEGKAFGGGASSTANGTAGQNQLRSQADQLGLPPGFLIARQLGHLGHVLTQARVPGFKERQQFVADAVAGEGEMAVGGVLAPGLAQITEIGLDLGPGCCQKRAENDAAFRDFERWMNARQALSPRAAEELGENRFGLIVEGVGGGDCIQRNLRESFRNQR